MIHLVSNPIVLAVVTLYVLCLKKVNVLLALIISALVVGVCSGESLKHTMDLFVDGMGDNAETALSYILLGTFAAAMMHTGCTGILAKKTADFTRGRRGALFFLLGLVSMASQTLIPIHIAFIPMLIPPLLSYMDQCKIDRRVISCILAFGLTMPYIAIPAGFGIIFQGLVLDNMRQNDVPIAFENCWYCFAFLGLSMVLGLLFAVFVSYRRPRTYKKTSPIAFQQKFLSKRLSRKQLYIIAAAILATFAIQLIYHSLPLGALVGLSLLLVLKIVKNSLLDELMNEGIYMMGFIAFVMLAAAGFANVLKGTGCVQQLAQDLLQLLPANKGVCTFCILLIGLIITMGIGSSFGTIPIIATIFIPICVQLRYTPTQMVLLIAAAGALGDAGAPISDTTLGPTAGLNVDGQHDHIRDTCIPTFLHYNLPLFLFTWFAIQGEWF